MKKCEHPDCENDAMFKELMFGHYVCLEHLDYTGDSVIFKTFTIEYCEDECYLCCGM